MEQLNKQLIQGGLSFPQENVANRDMKYKRSGENMSVIGSVRNPQNEAVFATLPVGFRPVQHIAFPALAYGYTPANFVK